MAFDVLGAAITGVLLYMSLRRRSDVGAPMVAAALFGFFVAGTGAHEAIHSGLHSIVLGVIDLIKNHVH